MTAPRAVVGVVGTKGAFDRLTDALAAWGRAHPGAAVWVQHGEGRLPDGLAGAPLVRREALLEKLAAADVVVTHAGSGAVRDALVLGHCPVVVPRLARFGEHVNDHQLELVDALGDRVEAVRELTPAALDAAIARAAARRGPAGSDAGAHLKDALRDDLAAVAAAPAPRRRALVWRALALATGWVPRRAHRWGDDA
ncbi:MAG: hypothetical protein H6745_18255 [Deltaproteobacteria bacterium]|nr:hypothetical protein [Deltaproteobacteria bacterium]